MSNTILFIATCLLASIAVLALLVGFAFVAAFLLFKLAGWLYDILGI